MEKMRRWAAKYFYHLLVALPLGLLIGVNLIPEEWIWGALVGLLLWSLMLMILLRITKLRDSYLRKALDTLKDNCDPNPLHRETQEQMTYPGPKLGKRIMTVNYAMALRALGEYDKSLEILQAVDVEGPAVPQMVKFVYNNNRMDLYALLGRYDEAVIWYEKTAQSFHQMKPGKRKETVRPTVEQNGALYHYCKGEYDLALGVLHKAKPENMLARIENAMMFARVYLAMGEREKAVKPLRFVAEKGNKLYFATEANMLLEKINMEEATL